MSQIRSKSLVVACLTAFLLLLGQTFVCFAEHANLLPCVHECGDSHDAGQAQNSTGDCDAAACHSVFVAISHGFSIPIYPVCEEFFSPAKSAPDAPVREIDYPPQLS